MQCLTYFWHSHGGNPGSNPGIATKYLTKAYKQLVFKLLSCEVRRNLARRSLRYWKSGRNVGPFRAVPAGMAERRERCDEKSRQSVAKKRDGRTIVLFSRARGKLRLNTSSGGILLSLGAHGAGAFSCGDEAG